MPYKNKADRDYRNEYDAYQGTPEQIKNRAKRNKARAEMAKEGRVHKGDGKDVDHKVPLSKGGTTGKKNLAVKSVKANRSYRRNSDGSVK
jgi:hypothetical protein